MGMGIKIGQKTLLIIIVLIAIGIVTWSVSGYFVKDESDDSDLTGLDKFAKCLSDKGATMYGAGWCRACKSQKRMFGASFKYVNYVECPDKPNVCIDAGIEAYPTWIINGLPHVNVQSFERLSELTGCSLS